MFLHRPNSESGVDRRPVPSSEEYAMTGSETSIWHHLVGHCWTEHHRGTVQVHLWYAAADPYAVHILLATRASQTSIGVVVGRDLLTDGLAAPTGEGAVRVTPFTPGRTCLTLHHVAGGLWLLLDTADIRRFLAETHTLVARGDEGCLSDLDAELQALTDPT
jgi:Streptomyces sporulation and cell division protein, SsgA